LEISVKFLAALHHSVIAGLVPATHEHDGAGNALPAMTTLLDRDATGSCSFAPASGRGRIVWSASVFSLTTTWVPFPTFTLARESRRG
jgi:hypothetical protein